MVAACRGQRFRQWLRQPYCTLRLYRKQARKAEGGNLGIVANFPLSEQSFAVLEDRPMKIYCIDRVLL